MAKRRQAVNRRGKIWTVAKVRWKEAQEEDFRFWYEGLTPEERVEAVATALEDCLKTHGNNGLPRLRRVHRRVKCRWAG